MNTKYTIDLGNGNVLNNMELNGNNYVSDTQLTIDIFDGMTTVTITGTDGSVKTIAHAKLVQFSLFPDGKYYIVFDKLSEDELHAMANDAQILFTAIATDTLLEEV